MKQATLARARALLVRSGVPSDSLLSGAKNSQCASEFILSMMCDKLDACLTELGKVNEYSKDIRVDAEVINQARRA